MNIEPGSVEHLSQLISHVVAPAFLLSAVGSFITLLSDRLTLIVHRVRDSGNPTDAEGKAIVERLRKRAQLINLSILFGALSGIAALVLIIASFTAALANMHHVWIAAALFMISAFFLLCSLVTFFIDVRMALTAHDLH